MDELVHMVSDVMEISLVHISKDVDDDVRLGDWIIKLYQSDIVDWDPVPMILSMIYVDRFVNLHPNFKGSKRKIGFIATTLALKYQSEQSYYNSDFLKPYKDIFTLDKINAMEIEMLKRLDYRLLVREEEFVKYCDYLLELSIEEVCTKIVERVKDNVMNTNGFLKYGLSEYYVQL